MRTQYFYEDNPSITIPCWRHKNGHMEYWCRTDKRWVNSCRTLDGRCSDNLPNPRWRKISRDEARKRAPGAFKTVRVVAAVAGVVIKPGLELANKFRKLATIVPDYASAGKIRAIKALRCMSTHDDYRLIPVHNPMDISSLGNYEVGPNQGFGLAESKMIVENFAKFLEFVETHNEIPAISWDYNHPFSKRPKCLVEA